MNDTVRSLLPLIPAFASCEVKITPLGGGLTNHNFRLDAGGSSYVLRIAGAGTEELGIDRQREYACAAAAAAGVGPAVVAFLPERWVLVTAFVNGKELKAEDLSDVELLRRVVGAIRRFHDHPVPVGFGPFEPFAIIRDYHRKAQDRQVPLPPDLCGAMALLGQIEKQTAGKDAPCLCHNDLLAGNFIRGTGGVVIIDWEYAGAGDRIFDLGNFAANLKLAPENEPTLLRLYLGREPREDELRRLRLMRLVSDLREATWNFVQQGREGTPELPEEYRKRGHKLLGDYLTAARDLLA